VQRPRAINFIHYERPEGYVVRRIFTLVETYSSVLAGSGFGLKIDFAKNTEDPARVFRALSGLIDFCQYFDKSLVRALNLDIKPILLLEDIDQGSITGWLKNSFRTSKNEIITDRAIWQALSRYLNTAKRIFIDFFRDRDTVESLEEITGLQRKLLHLAEASPLSTRTICGPVSQRELLEGVDKFQLPLRELMVADKAYYLLNEESSSINLDLNISASQIEKILLGEVLENEQEMILKIKKPDYLGDSKWVFRHGKRTIEAKMNDLEWMQSFRRREIPVVPGDAFRAVIRSVTKYDFNGELLSEQISVQRVIEVIPDIYEQLSLFPEKD